MLFCLCEHFHGKYCSSVFPEGTCFSCSYPRCLTYVEENENVPCDWIWLKTAFTDAFIPFSSVTFLPLADSRADFAEFCMCAAVHTREVLCLGRKAAADALCSLLHLSGLAAEQLSLFCTVLFFLQNCLWQFVLILYYPRVLQAIK